METDRKYIARDTRDVLEGSFDREYLLRGFWFMGTDSPIFDSLAADRFASDRPVNPFNLGDYR